MRPLWWWFAVHGALAAAFGVFTLATPFTDAPGYLLDGHAFAILAFVAGAQVAIQAWLSRHYGAGWVVLLLAGLHAVAAGVVLWILAALEWTYALFWSCFGFLLLEGLLLILGLLRSSLYRMWGMLMGGCMVLTALSMSVVWLLDPGHSFDIPDAWMGVTGLLYGVAVFVAALQTRAEQQRGPASRA